MTNPSPPQTPLSLFGAPQNNAPTPPGASAAGVPWLVGTWNVNSVRMRLQHIQRFLVEYRPQVLCLQETKVQDDHFPHQAFAELGYHCALFGEKKNNGVAILSLNPLEQVERGFLNQPSTPSTTTNPQNDTEPALNPAEEPARIIHGVYQGVHIFNVYFPNGTKVGTERFAFKLAFYQRLKQLLETRFSPHHPVLVVGDFNVAPAAIDVHDPLAWEGKICYHPQEREVLGQLKQWGFWDVFRHFEPTAQRYTWWDFRTRAFERNAGLRIDFIWASMGMKGRATQCWIETAERERDKPSDHVPVMAYFR